jgi:hypothetical protein
MYKNIVFKKSLNNFNVFYPWLGGENPPHLVCISKIKNYNSFKGNIDHTAKLGPIGSEYMTPARE